MRRIAILLTVLAAFAFGCATSSKGAKKETEVEEPKEKKADDELPAWSKFPEEKTDDEESEE